MRKVLYQPPSIDIEEIEWAQGPRFFSAVPLVVSSGAASRAVIVNTLWVPPPGLVRDAFFLTLGGLGDPARVRGLSGPVQVPVTKKFAILSRSTKAGADADYKLGQGVEDLDKDGKIIGARIDWTAPCGNIGCASAARAIELDYVRAQSGITKICLHQVNNGTLLRFDIQTPGGIVNYVGDAATEGVTGTTAPVLMSSDVPPPNVLLPTGNQVDVINGVPMTLADLGMKTAVMLAEDIRKHTGINITGKESPEELQKNPDLVAWIEETRKQAGRAMGMKEVEGKGEPKMMIVSEPTDPEALIALRCFNTYGKVHPTVGAFAGMSAAFAATLPDAPAHKVARIPPGEEKRMLLQHNSGLLPATLFTDASGHVTGIKYENSVWKIMEGVAPVNPSVMRHNLKLVGHNQYQFI